MCAAITREIPSAGATSICMQFLFGDCSEPLFVQKHIFWIVMHCAQILALIHLQVSMYN